MRSLLLAAVCLTLISFAERRAANADQAQGQAAAAPAEKQLSPKELRKYYSQTVLDHVNAKTKETGAFAVHDDILNKDWRLKMVKVHTDRIWDMKNGHFFACADLKEVGDKKTKVDLDFYVSKHGDQWIMDKVIVHKVAGKPRYAYVEDGGKWFMEFTETKKRIPAD